jgi:hypothetical protein
MFKNRVLRRIFGPKREEVTGGWGKLHEELHSLQLFKKGSATSVSDYGEKIKSTAKRFMLMIYVRACSTIWKLLIPEML